MQRLAGALVVSGLLTLVVAINVAISWVLYPFGISYPSIVIIVFVVSFLFAYITGWNKDFGH